MKTPFLPDLLIASAVVFPALGLVFSFPAFGFGLAPLALSIVAMVAVAGIFAAFLLARELATFLAGSKTAQRTLALLLVVFSLVGMGAFAPENPAVEDMTGFVLSVGALMCSFFLWLALEAEGHKAKPSQSKRQD